jgi:Zn-dependent protease
MRGGWTIARIGGVPVRVDTSLLVLAVLATWALWQGRFTSDHFPELSSTGGFMLAVLTTLLFIGSILAHELAHAGMFRARGIEVSAITLYMFGGLTAAKTEARGPADEFLVTVVGPLTTGLVGGLFIAIHRAAQGALSGPVDHMFLYLGALNLYMAVLNLLPGFPLDGGRLVLAGVWRVTGDRGRAVRVAARLGQGVALLIGAVGVVSIVAPDTVTGFGIWFVFIAFILFQGASAALADSDRRSRLDTATARQVMSPPPPTVPAGISIAQAMERHLAGHEGEAFPVVDDGQVVGFISLRVARQAPLDRFVRDAMIGADAVATVTPAEAMGTVVDRMQQRRAQIALVVDEGRLVGVIEREDLDRFFRAARRR